MRLRVAFVGCLLAGCGSISDNSNNIDAAPDMTGPKVVFPDNDSTGVVPLSPISVIFDKQLDPATVTAETVKVTYRQLTIALPAFAGGGDDYFTELTWPGSLDEPVRGDVSYDPELRKIHFVPKAPLLTGQTYTVSFVGVKDVNGYAFEGAPFKFRTIVNAEAHRYYFSDRIATSYYDYDPDTTTGRMTRQAYRGSPGPDREWHTSDDPLGELVKFEIAPDGRVIEERYIVPGDDGMLGTSDDLPAQSIFYKYDSTNKLTERALMFGPGADNVYGTADDSFYNYTKATYNGESIERYVTYNAPGSDTNWRTGDDLCAFQQEPVYMGSLKFRDVVKDCGGDAQPHTPDDHIIKYREYTYDANGQLTELAYRTDIGPDGIWFTADDRGGTQTEYERDAKGLITKTTYKTIGPDNKWKTADDLISSYELMTNDENGLLIENTFFYGKGTDGTWNTADDWVSFYVVHTYDARGVRLKSQSFNAGDDAAARTDDDRLDRDSRYDVVH
jgi:hypothetical protein